VKRGLLVVPFALGLLCAGAFSAAVVAETTTSATTTAPSTTTAPTTTTATTTTVTTTTTPTVTTPTTTRSAPRPKTVPPRVHVAGVNVGGLDPASASAAVSAAFAAPLDVVVDRTRLRLDPTKLATAYVTGAVARARASRPGARVQLVVAVHGAAVRAFTARLAKRYDRASLDAQLSLRDGRPSITRDHVGRSFNAKAATLRIVHALVTNSRRELRFRTKVVEPEVTHDSFGPVIVINRSAKHLYLYDGTKPWRTFGVATGQSVYPTPSGTFRIVVMYRNPWWYPPTSSEWARGLKPVPPGPGNPLGTRWMGLSAAGVGIHGTPDAASIGYSASHGCIRMLIPDAEWLFDHVRVGTTVFIV
jgi:lipoprotein-anchoring transpeptidase ErfK/SrfK